MLCNTFIVEAYTHRRGEARRQGTRPCFFTRERYSLAKTNHWTAHSNDYSSFYRFYNFELPSRRLYSRHHTHMREVRQGELHLASLTIGEANFASPRVCLNAPLWFYPCNKEYNTVGTYESIWVLHEQPSSSNDLNILLNTSLELSVP